MLRGIPKFAFAGANGQLCDECSVSARQYVKINSGVVESHANWLAYTCRTVERCKLRDGVSTNGRRLVHVICDTDSRRNC